MMNRKKTILINGGTLTPEQVALFAGNPKITVIVADSAYSSIAKARKFLEKELPKRIIYGVNTGFGPMASRIINIEHTEELQENLIKSHAVGIGKPLDGEYVLAAMIVRLNTLARGFSGVSPELIKYFEKFINHRIAPVIPEHGAVGTSGDLVQLAHIALAFLGEGDVFYTGKRQPAKRVLRELHMRPYRLKAKEGLSLINGTSAMAGIAAVNSIHAKRIVRLATRTGAFGIELVNGFNDSTAERLHRLRPHKGQIAIAKELRAILASSQRRRTRRSLQDSQDPSAINGKVHEIPQVVQEIYSFRCIPQILGPVHDTVDQAKKQVATEINSITDNPIVDWETNNFLHGGNFHGDYIALAMDQLKIALVKLTMLSERRINFFLHERINRYLPPFLNLEKPGLTLGLQGLQFVATSTTSQSQTLAFPQYIHSIPTNADNQDIVSMGTDAALFASKVIENAYIVLAIELITMAQASDFLGIQNELSDSSRELFTKIRKIFPKIQTDRVLVNELPRVVNKVKEL